MVTKIDESREPLYLLPAFTGKEQVKSAELFKSGCTELS